MVEGAVVAVVMWPDQFRKRVTTLASRSMAGVWTIHLSTLTPDLSDKRRKPGTGSGCVLPQCHHALTSDLAKPSVAPRHAWMLIVPIYGLLIKPPYPCQYCSDPCWVPGQRCTYWIIDKLLSAILTALVSPSFNSWLLYPTQLPVTCLTHYSSLNTAIKARIIALW